MRRDVANGFARAPWAFLGASLLLLTLAAPAFGQLVSVEKTDTNADDVDQIQPPPAPPNPPRELQNPPGEVEWEVTITNQEGPGGTPVTNWTFVDDLRAFDNCHDISATQCSALTVLGDPTVTIDCNETTEIITISGIDIQPQESVVITFRATLDCGDQDTCNQASVCDTAACDNRVVTSRDPLVPFGNVPSCVRVGAGGGGTPGFFKYDDVDDDVEISPQSGNPSIAAPGRVHWVLELNNPTNQALDGVMTDDLPDEQTIDCGSPIDILLDGNPHPNPPNTVICDPAAAGGQPNLQVGDIGDELPVPGQSVVTVKFWADVVVPNPPQPSTCNQAIHAITGGQTLGSQPQGAPNPQPSCIEYVTQPPLRVTMEKAADVGSALPGDTITWTITLSQNADQPVVINNLTDDIEASQEYVGGSLMGFPGATCDAVDNTGDTVVDAIECSNITVPAQPGTIEMSFQTTVVCDANLANTGQVCNTASAENPAGGPPIPSQPPGGNPGEPTCVTADIPVLDMTKSASWVDGTQNQDGVLNEGDIITWSVEVCNTGASATNVVISDPIPADTTYVADSILVDGASQTDASGDDDGEFDGSEVRGLQASLAGGACVTLEFDTTLGAVGAGSDIINSATAVSDETSACPQVSDMASLTSGEAGAVSITKTLEDLNGGNPLPGDRIRYSIEVCNNDNVNPLNQADVTDGIPTGTTYEAGSIRIDAAAQTDASGDDQAEFDGTSVLADLAPIASLDCVILDFVVVVDGVPDGTTIDNTATVTTPTGDLQDTASFTTASLPYTLEVTKSAVDVNGGTLAPGDEIEYTIQTCNTGNSDAPNVVLEDPIPTDTTYVTESIAIDGNAKTDAAGDDEAEFNGTMVIGQLGTIAPGTCVTLTFSVTVDAGVGDGTDITNQATSTGEDGAGGSAVDSAVLTVAPGTIQLNVTKTATDDNGDPLEPGDTIIYEIEVCNEGDATAPAVQLSDPIPTDTTYSTETIMLDGVPQTDAAGDDSAEFTGTEVVVSLGDLDPGVCSTVTFEVTVDTGVADGTPIDNMADAATNDGAGPETATDTASLTTGSTGRELRRSMMLDTMTDPATEQCPANQQVARINTVCMPADCPVVTPDTEWRILGDGAFDGTRDLWHYEVPEIPCSETLFISKDPANRDDLLGQIQ